MSRYIDADLLQAQIERGAEMTEKGIRLLDLSQQPTADVEPVVHAHWEYNPDGMDWGLGAWVCSRCQGKNNNIGAREDMNPLMFGGSQYCPHCGAHMDEQEET